MCIIDRCTEDKSVRLFRLCHEFIDFVIRKHTAIFITLSTSDTVSHRLTADLKDLILDALSFQFLSYFQKRLVCIAFFFALPFNINTFILSTLSFENARDKITFTPDIFSYIFYKYIFFAHYFTHQNSCRPRIPSG